MGLMQFSVPDPRRLPADAAARAHLTGADGVPWLSRVVRTEKGLIADRPAGDSGSFHVPWRLDGRGELVLSTTSLMERAKPYHLAVELARGTVCRMRAQLAVWESAGLVVPIAERDALQAAMGYLRRAATAQHQPETAEPFAQHAIDLAMTAGDGVARAFADQALSARQRQAGKLPTLFGIRLTDTPLDDATGQLASQAMNTAIVPLRWSLVETSEGRFDWSTCDQQVFWCQAQGLRICGGPLLSLDDGSLPSWLTAYEADFDRIVLFATRFAQQAVTRYQGRVQLWICSARTNVGDALALREEQKLRLTLRCIETVRRAAPQIPAIVSLDLPWGEHMLHHEIQLSPLHFADQLVRADLGLAGFALEVNAGYVPGGTFPRDLTAFSYLVDRWSGLSLPLVVQLTFPSGESEDPLAEIQARPLSTLAPTTITPELQRDWLAGLVPLLLAKQVVQGVFWNQLTDAAAHDWPLGGLLDAASQPKPAFKSWHAIRQDHVV
jgi:hypothetical protein